MIRIQDILGLIDKVFPFFLAEPWDNCGLQAGNPDWPVKRILVGLDVSMPMLDHAAEWEADMVLTHHPLLIKGEKQWDFGKMPGSAIAFAAKNQISIVSAHTNLDKAWQGLNDYVAAKMGLKVESVFVPDSFFSSSTAKTDGAASTGLGRLCSLHAPQSVQDMISHIKRALGLAKVLVIGDTCRKIRTAALCTGSGGSLIDAFLHSGADVYITGDLKYHEARTIENHGKMAIDIGHFGSEHPAVDLLVEKVGQCLAQEGYQVKMKGYTGEKDPFVIV